MNICAMLICCRRSEASSDLSFAWIKAGAEYEATRLEVVIEYSGDICGPELIASGNLSGAFLDCPGLVLHVMPRIEGHDWRLGAEAGG